MKLESEDLQSILKFSERQKQALLNHIEEKTTFYYDSRPGGHDALWTEEDIEETMDEEQEEDPYEVLDAVDFESELWLNIAVGYVELYQ